MKRGHIILVQETGRYLLEQRKANINMFTVAKNFLSGH
jgi:hypothetical protein